MLFAAAEGVAPELFQQSRGWSADDWGAATDRLGLRDLLGGDGRPTAKGRQMRDHIERRTDELAVLPYRAAGDDRCRRLLPLLGEAASTIADAGEITYPNPMGLPPPGRTAGPA